MHTRPHAHAHTHDHTTLWQGVCTSEGHHMKRFTVKASLRQMRRHVGAMGQPRVWCEHCNADSSVRWERAERDGVPVT